MAEGPEWFAPKTYGYGSGQPVAWQGWVLLIGYLALALLGAAFLAPRNPLLFLALFIPLTAVFIFITKQTTRGGWRWRWGDKD